MSDKPPPLPVAEEIAVSTKEEARPAPPHAPLLWRTLAFLVDASVLALLGYLVATRVLIPQYMPEELAVFNTWMDDNQRHQQELLRAVEAGRITDPLALIRASLDRAKEVPEGVHSLLLYFSNCMTITFWIGFSAMEIGTRGASLGKKMFRLRTATFPACERPGILDSLIRSGWKAMAIGSVSPLVTLFALVDAHWPLFNPLRRSLHDVMCRTLVLDARFDPPEQPRDDEEDE